MYNKYITIYFPSFKEFDIHALTLILMLMHEYQIVNCTCSGKYIKTYFTTYNMCLTSWHVPFTVLVSLYRYLTSMD